MTEKQKDIIDSNDSSLYSKISQNNNNSISNDNSQNNNLSKEELNEEIQDNAIEELLILKQTIEEKNEMIEKLKKENDENKELLVRLKADFENYKKRVREDQKDMVKFSNQRLITDILPVLDDLDRAIISATEEIKNTSFFEGLNMVIKSLHDILEKRYFLQRIDEINVTFDPHFHEAISMIEDDKINGMIVEKILQPGYKIDSRILRSAKVIVRKGVSNKIDEKLSDNNEDEKNKEKTKLSDDEKIKNINEENVEKNSSQNNDDTK